MPRPPIRGPTERELQILTILWQRGPSTVREVFESLEPATRPAYTSVLSVMQTMTDKELVTRDVKPRSHIYRAAPSRDEIEEVIAKDMIGRVFEGSAVKLVTRALVAKPASRAELDQLQALLDMLRGTSS